MSIPNLSEIIHTDKHKQMCACVFLHACICLCTVHVKKREFPFLWELQYFKLLESGENRNINNSLEQNKQYFLVYECYLLFRSLTCNKTAPVLLTAKLLFLIVKL